MSPRLGSAVAEADPAPLGPADEAGFDLLVFKSHGALFGVLLDQIREIVEVEDFARLTVSDPSLRGALYTGRDWIPMFDIARRLDIGAKQRYEAPVLLVTTAGGTTVGFLVDDPEDVITVGRDVFRPMPELILRTRSRESVYATGLLRDGRLLLLLDLGALLDPAEAAEASRICREHVEAEAP